MFTLQHAVSEGNQVIRPAVVHSMTRSRTVSTRHRSRHAGGTKTLRLCSGVIRCRFAPVRSPACRLYLTQLLTELVEATLPRELFVR